MEVHAGRSLSDTELVDSYQIDTVSTCFKLHEVSNGKRSHSDTCRHAEFALHTKQLQYHLGCLGMQCENEMGFVVKLIFVAINVYSSFIIWVGITNYYPGKKVHQSIENNSLI